VPPRLVEEGARLEIGFTAKGQAKTLVAVQVSKLAGKALVERDGAAWKKTL